MEFIRLALNWLVSPISIFIQPSSRSKLQFQLTSISPSLSFLTISALFLEFRGKPFCAHNPIVRTTHSLSLLRISFSFPKIPSGLGLSVGKLLIVPHF
jgi:hypothetical protein